MRSETIATPPELRRALPAREILAVAAMLLHYLVFYCNNAMFVMRQTPREELILPGAAHMAGVLLCALVCPVLERRGKAMAALLLFLVLSRLPGFDGWLNAQPARLLMAFAYGLSIPLVYSAFFAGVRAGRRGLAYGCCVGAGIAAVTLPLLLMRPPASPAAWNALLERLFFANSAGIIALAAVLFALQRLGRAAHPPGAALAAVPFRPGTRSRRPALFLAAVALFFLLNGFLSIRILPVLGHKPFDGSAWYLLLCALACPLAGRLLDRSGRAFFSITRLCAFALILAPLLGVLSGQPSFFSALHWSGTLANLLFSLAMTLAAASMAGKGPWRCLLLCSVYILHLAALPGMWLFRQSAGIPAGVIVLIGTATAALLYDLIGRMRLPADGGAGLAAQGAGQAVAGPSEPAPPENGNSDRALAAFQARGLTPRECEVAALLLRGLSTRAIAEEMDLAEHTVRNHIRRLLAKFGVSTRKAFLAAMLDV